MVTSSRPPHPPRARTGWRWPLAGLLLGALAGLLGFAPAAWVQAGVNAASAQRLQLSDAQGSVWQGSARLALTGGSDARDALALPGRVVWDLGLEGVHGHLHLDLACCTGAGLDLRFAPGWNGWTLQLAPGTSVWPAAMLSGLGTPWNTLQPQGQLQVQNGALEWRALGDHWLLDGAVQIDALDMASRLSTLRPLGSYRVQLRGGAQATLRLDTLSGPLRLEGSGAWLAGRLHFHGTASAEPQGAAELDNLLNIIGRREGVHSVIELG